MWERYAHMTDEAFWAIVDFNWPDNGEYNRVVRWAKTLIALYG